MSGLSSGSSHSSDRQSNLTGPTFTALTPPATLFDVVLAVLTPLERDFWPQVAPTWAAGPSLTLEKPLFSFGFHTFHEIATFAIK